MRWITYTIPFFCTAALLCSCRSLADYSSKSNNPTLYQNMIGRWRVLQSFRYDGYARKLSEQPKGTTLAFGENGQLVDQAGLLAEFYAQKYSTRLQQLSWQVAEDGNGYITLAAEGGQKLTDLKLSLLTKDELNEKLRLDPKEASRLPDGGTLYFTLRDVNDCSTADFPVRILGGSHGCAYMLLVLSAKKA